MCGIAGWIDWREDLRRDRSRNILDRMGSAQSHRGPDESGRWSDERVGLAHERLIVVDPEGGKQPMVKEVGGDEYVMVYNGELYNTDDLRKELKDLGYTFRSYSDTEVLLTSYIQWGKASVKRLNGIYAFAIWDRRKQELYMARDRIGVKPLFYKRDKQSLLFSSELKGLLAHPKVEASIGCEGLNQLLIMGPGRSPGSGIFSGVKELKPGHSLTYNSKGIVVERYWELKSCKHQDSLEDTIKRVRELFVDAVERQLVSDTPLCTLLSGGLDSSAITSIASNYFKGGGRANLHTYSVDYEDNSEYFEADEFQPSSDNKWIELMVNYSDTKHSYITLDNDSLVEALKDSLLARDLPGMVDIDSSLYLFCKEIKKDFTVGISGECADEIFGGYPWYYQEEALGAETFPWSRSIDQRLNIIKPELARKINPKEYLDQKYKAALAEVPLLEGEGLKEARMREIFYLNLTRWMPTLLDRKDRMSMYTGLEVRVPFCDHRLVEYAWNIPWEMKSLKGRRKGILREALYGLLPQEVRLRPKSPYPKTFNPAYFKVTRELLLEVMNNSNSPLLQLVDVDYLLKITRADKDFDIPWYGQLMRLPQLFAYLVQLNSWIEGYGVEIRGV